MLERLCGLLSGFKMTVLSLLFFLLAVGIHLLKVEFSFDFLILTILISGIPIMYKGLKMLFLKYKMTASLLITIAMTASIAVNQYFAAAEVALIMAIGGLLENATIEKAKKGIKSLLTLAPVAARKIIGDKEENILAKDIIKGDIIRVLAGENIPADGKIISGETSINQAVITGESFPVDKKAGDEVYSGTTNCDGVIEIEVQKPYEDSTVQKLIKLVKETEANKAPTKRIVDIWASFLIPMAIIFALSVYFVTGEILRAVTVLVVFCPCSLVLATPVSIMAAIGHAAKNGVIVKSGEALEIIGKCSVFAFDKTGTITKGTLSVDLIESFSSDISIDTILYYAASGEKMSEHPIGAAIVDFALSKNIELALPIDFKSFSGRGIYSKLNNKRVFIGCEKFMTDNNIDLSGEVKQAVNTKRLEGKIALLVSFDGEVKGLISLSDTLKSTAIPMADKLKAENVKTVMLTGDNSLTAEYFGKKAGMEYIYSGLLPKEKANLIQKFHSNGEKTSMTGDGVNDAVALKAADVGISMGKFGSDIAIESSDIIVTGDDLLKIPYLISLSKLCIKTIKINIIISMTINVISLTLSAMGFLNPITGAIVHNFASIIVVLNAAFLYDKKID